ncbi:hypothetical protein RB594_003650 [Gaeumannomyces avenae]
MDGLIKSQQVPNMDEPKVRSELLRGAFIDNIWPAVQGDYKRMMEGLKELLEKGLMNEGVYAGLSARVKEAESIDKSLRRRDDHLAKNKGKRFESLNEVLHHVHDLVGLRVVVPFRHQRIKAKEFIERTFSQQGEPTYFSPDREVGQKWKRFEFGAYETLNYRLSYRTGQYRDVTFEVQLTGLAEHLFNIVNHPFLYKGAYGPLTEAEEMVLDQLHGHAKGFTLSIQQLVKDRLRPHSQTQGIQQGDRDAMVAITRNLLSRIIQESDTILNHVVKGVEGGKTPTGTGDQKGPTEQLNKLFDRIQIAVNEAKRPRYHNIPFPRNEAYVDRGGVFSELERLLPSRSESQTAALWGLGGSGKTQMALEYAYRRWHSAPCSVFWVHADNEATFTQDYQSIAKKLRVPADLQDKELLAAVRDRIQTEPSWVLVLDNADNLRLFGVDRRKPGAQLGGQPHGATTDHAPKNLREFLPWGPTGTVLWTTRDEGITGSLVVAQRTINVARMEINEAVKLLETMRNKAVDDVERDDASALLAELDWLPLAISQAAAYMRRTRTPIEKYLSKLKGGKGRWRILRASEPDVHRRCEVPNSILETWSISIEHIREENEMAYNILHILAFLDNQNIPEQMVKELAKQRDIRRTNEQSSDSEDEDAMDAITRLREFSFLSLRASDWGRAYDMHKLVQEAARFRLRAKEDETYFAKAALRIATDLFPKRRRELWEEAEKYLVHAQRVGEWAELCGEEKAAALLSRVSDYLYDRGRWRDREPVDEKAYELRKRVLGDKHPDTIRSMAELATTYHALGRYGEGEKISAEVLALRRGLLGDKHPDTIRSTVDLATTYHALGRYGEAEKIYVEVLALRRDIFGNKHPDTIRSIADLATTCHVLGRYGEAEKMKLEVLALRRDVLGDKHLDTIQSMASLAATYHNQRRYDEAEKIKVEALALRRDVLGNEHPDTIWAIASLATTCHALEKYDEAEKMKVEVWTLRRDLLGNRHLDTIRSMADLATTYNSQGKYDEAKKMKLEVLALRRDALGNKHPDTIRSIAELATTCHALGKYGEAEKMKVEVLALRRDVFGDKHPDTIRSMAELAATYYNQGRYDEAKEIYVEVLVLRRDTLGDKHPDTIRSMADLAAVYHHQGRYDETEKIKAEIWALRREMLGDKHPDTIRSMAELATTYYALGKYGEDEKISAEVLALRRDIFGYKHPDTIRSMADLATTYHALGRYDEAEKMKLEVLALRRGIFGDKHPDTVRSIAELGKTYHELGRYEETERMNMEALALRRDVLGDKHPDTIQSTYDLAITWNSLGRYDEAEKKHVEVLTLRRVVLGDKHPDTIQSIASLAATYHDQGRYGEAETIKVEALALRRDVLGNKHPETIQSMHDLAITWNSLGRYDEALAMMDDCVRLWRRVLGPNHPYTQASLRVLKSWKRDWQKAAYGLPAVVAMLSVIWFLYTAFGV